MQQGGIESRQRDVLRADQEPDLGAAEDDAVGAVGAPAVCLALRGKRKNVARLPFPNTRRAAYAFPSSASGWAPFRSQDS